VPPEPPARPEPPALPALPMGTVLVRNVVTNVVGRGSSIVAWLAITPYVLHTRNAKQTKAIACMRRRTGAGHASGSRRASISAAAAL